VVGARGVPAGLGGERLEPAGLPGAAHHAPCAQDQPDSRLRP
jgi:hypothetical protein